MRMVGDLMSDSNNITCPCCNNFLRVQISDEGGLLLLPFSETVLSEVETAEILKKLNIEFG